MVLDCSSRQALMVGCIGTSAPFERLACRIVRWTDPIRFNFTSRQNWPHGEIGTTGRRTDSVPGSTLHDYRQDRDATTSFSRAICPTWFIQVASSRRLLCEWAPPPRPLLFSDSNPTLSTMMARQSLALLLLFTTAHAFAPVQPHHQRIAVPAAPKQPTQLNLVAQPGVAVAAITGALTGGFFAGGLHAIAGEF